MRVQIKQEEIQSIEGRLASVEIVAKLGLLRIVRFAPLWVRIAIIMVYLITSPRYQKFSNTRTCHQDNRINNVENSENTEQNVNSENQNVNCINYNEQFNSECDSSDANYVAMVENFNTTPIALQNMTITKGSADCNLLLDSGGGCTNCTIINMSLAKQI